MPSVLVWGLNSHATDEEVHSLFGPEVTVEDRGIHAEEDVAWVALHVADVDAAMICVAQATEHAGLQAYIERDWQNFGTTAATAEADLRQLAVDLGCEAQPRLLYRPEGLLLVRGAAAIFRAVRLAGDVLEWNRRDHQAACCIAFGLLIATHDMVHSSALSAEVHLDARTAFLALAPSILPDAAAALQRGLECGATWATTAAQLLNTLMVAPGNVTILAAHELRATAGRALDLTDAVVEALPPALQALRAASSAALLGDKGAKQRPQHTLAVQQQQQQQQAMELAALACRTLLAAVSWLLASFRERTLHAMIPPLHLEATLGRIIRQVVLAEEIGNPACVAGASLPCNLPVAKCLWTMHICINSNFEAAAAEDPDFRQFRTVHPALVKAMRSALDRLPHPRHIGTLIGLLLVNSKTVPDNAPPSVFREVIRLVGRVQALAIKWLEPDGAGLDADQLATIPPFGPLRSFRDQAALLVDLATAQLTGALQAVLAACNMTSAADVKSNASLVADSRVIHALTAALQVPPDAAVHNMRQKCKELGLGHEDISIMPSVYEAVDALRGAALLASCAAAHGKPTPAEVVAELVRGGLACLTVASAEAASCGAARGAGRQFVYPSDHPPFLLRRDGARIIHLAAAGLPPLVARSLAGQGLVPALLQALPWPPTPEDIHTNSLSLMPDTLAGIASICDCLAAIFTADPASRGAALQGGDWNAATQRVKAVLSRLQPDGTAEAQCAADLGKVEAALRSKGSGGGGGGGSGARRKAGGHVGGSMQAADAAAVLAAERAMQVLLAADEPTATTDTGTSQPSKAAAKRARKKAARQASVAAAAQGAASGTVQQQAASKVAAPSHEANDGAQDGHLSGGTSAAAQQIHSPALADSSSSSSTDAPLPSDKDLPDWCRCPLSGGLMRDPVLLGGGDGTSFERAAVEAWLEAHPGVTPLTLQPLPHSSRLQLISNHVLRQMIQRTAACT